MLETTKKRKNETLKQNIIFATTIYDTFEALEETLGKLKLEEPLFLTYIAKKAFADEVLKSASNNKEIYLNKKPANVCFLDDVHIN